MSKLPRIMFVCEAGDSACAYYRAELPAKGLRKLGYPVDVVSIMFEDDAHALRGVMVTPEGKQWITDKADIIICRRLNGPDGELLPSSKMFKAARKRGQRIFFDIDDDMWNLPEYNPAYVERKPGELETWEEDMNAADGVIVSTLPLMEETLLHVNVPAYVCRNGIDTSLYTPAKEPRPGPLRLAWMGAMHYRRRDLEMIVEPLRTVLDGRFGEVELWHLGKMEKTGRLGNIPSIHDVVGSGFPVQIREMSWVPLPRLPELLSNVDTVLVPQEMTPFTFARSTTTALACMAAGLPFAATGTPEYQRLWAQGGGYVVDNLVWDHAIHVMCDKEYEDARSNIRIGGLSLAASVYGPVNTARQYEEVWTGDR